MRRGQGAGLISGFANLCVSMPPVSIWQNGGGNWLKCRNDSFVTLELILLPQKPRPKNHHGALKRPGKAAVEKATVEKVAVENAAVAEAEVGQTGLAIIRAALNSIFLPKMRRTRPLCRADGLRILLGSLLD